MTMTKEECFDKHVGTYWRKLSPQSTESMTNAMSEYAKQQVISFIRWIHGREDTIPHPENADIWFNAEKGNVTNYTTEQLYELFIKEQQ
jgi:hypothetical protein